jgi:hypothetical protein
MQPTTKRNLYHLFETDKELELKGIQLKFGDSTFRVKRAGGANRDFDTKFQEKTRQVSSQLQMAALSPEQSDQILMEVYFEAVMLGWEDVTDRAGAELEFNLKNFVQVMTDLPDLWRGLRTGAANMDHFLVVQKKVAGETLGNS